MKLIALVIKQYDKLFKEQIFNFSDEYKVDFNFEANELKIDKNPDYIENFYGESIYNITPIVGINGSGKSTLLELIKYVTQNSDSHLNNNNSYFKVFKDNEKFKVDKHNIDIQENENFEVYGDDEQFQEPNVNTAINYYNLHNQFFWGVTGVPENSNILEMEINWSSLANYFRIYSEFYDKEIFSDFKFKISLTRSYFSPDSLTQALDNKKELIKEVCLTLITNIRDKIFGTLGETNKEKGESLAGLDSILAQIADYKSEDKDDWESDIKFYENKMKDLDDAFYLLKEGFYDVSFFEVFQRISSVLFLFKNYIIGIENEKIIVEFPRNLSQNQNFLKICKKFDSLCEFLNRYSYLGLSILNFDSFCMSAGETNFIRLFSNALTSQQFNEDIRDYIFLIDEIEMGMHLEWSRKLINNFVEFLKRERRREDVNLQLIFTTHSPYMLSDIKPGNVIMLEKNQETGYSEGKVLQNTFAKNIQEIMKENLIDNIYGDFALAKINSMISRLNGEVAQAGDEEEGLLKEIHLISEPILRNKLLEMYDKKYKTEESSIDKQLNQLNLNVQQRMQVKKMIEENNKK